MELELKKGVKISVSEEYLTDLVKQDLGITTETPVQITPEPEPTPVETKKHYKRRTSRRNKKPYKYYSVSDDTFIKEMIDRHGNSRKLRKEIAKELNRTPAGIYNRINVLYNKTAENKSRIRKSHKKAFAQQKRKQATKPDTPKPTTEVMDMKQLVEDHFINWIMDGKEAGVTDAMAVGLINKESEWPNKALSILQREKDINKTKGKNGKFRYNMERALLRYNNA